MCTGRSAPRSAPIATSTATCGRAASTRRGFSPPTCASCGTGRSWRRDATVGSIFIGGGTPSLMSAGTVGAILDEIERLWTIAPGAEVTLEANPSSVEAGRFRDYRAAGINRVSLGVQSLDDEVLRTLGPPAHGRGGACGNRRGARHVRALLLRPDLRAAAADARGVARRARSGPVARGRAPLALPAHHRGRHAVRRSPRPRPARDPRSRGGARPLRGDAGADRAGGPPRLRDLQSCAAGPGVPAQPALLALRRVRRRRPRRPRPRPRRRHAPRHDHGAEPGSAGPNVSRPAGTACWSTRHSAKPRRRTRRC